MKLFNLYFNLQFKIKTNRSAHAFIPKGTGRATKFLDIPTHFSSTCFMFVPGDWGAQPRTGSVIHESESIL